MHIKGGLLDQAVILFNCLPFRNGSKFFPLRAVPYGMENPFYYIRRPPLNVTIFNITHVCNFVMGATPMNDMVKKIWERQQHCVKSKYVL